MSGLRVYQIRAEVRRAVTLEVAARSAEQARKIVLKRTTGAARILDTAPVDALHSEASAHEALRHLGRAGFLDFNGADAEVRTWWTAGLTPDHRKQEQVNKALAFGGMRIYPGKDGPQLYIASTKHMAFLADAYAGSPWSDGRWADAICTLPDAFRLKSGLTFNGQRARALCLPLKTALAASVVRDVPAARTTQATN